MVTALALTFIAIASGAVLTYTYDEDAPLASRLCAGACIGFALMGLVGFVFASWLGLSGLATIWLTALVLLAPPLLLLANGPRRAQVGADLDQAISRATLGPHRWAFIYFLFYAVVAISMWLIFARALLEEPDGIYTGVLNNYGDLPFHISVITRFAFGQNFPPEDPTLAGVHFTYPFLTDFVSAMFVRAGASLRQSLFIENYVIGVALVGVLHRFGQQLLRNRTAAILTPVLILLNGGFGWAMLYGDVNKSDGGVFRVLAHIPHSYTILPDIASGWRWGNAITSLLVTQRGFLLGIPLAVIVFTLLWESLNEEGKRKKEKGKSEEGGKKRVRSSIPVGQQQDEELTGGFSSLFTFSFLLLPSERRMLAAGAIAGTLPLIHAHSFVVVILVAAFLVPWIYGRGWIAYGVAALVGFGVYCGALYYGVLTATFAKVAFVTLAIGLAISLFFLLPARHLRIWICFFVLAIAIGGPQILWSTHNSAVKTQSFLAWQFGWDSDEEEAFGSKPVGNQPIDTKPPLKAWVKRAPYVIWFWLKNTGLFIPLLIAALLWRREDYLVSRRLLLFYLPFTLCFLIPNFVKLAPWVWDNVKVIFYWWIASAPIVALFLARLWEGRTWHRVMAATLLVVLTLAGGLDVFPLLTGQGKYQEFDRDGIVFAETIKAQTPPRATILHAPIHNTPIFLTGRRSLMGYPGHIWTHGLDYGQLENEIKRIYAGAPDAANLLSKYHVDYVVIGPAENSVTKVDNAFFSRYPEIINTCEYHLYKITP
jgi:hypothetical protein